jgi:hypothetical protein
MNECTRCKGEKATHSPGFTSLEGVVYPPESRPCYCCDGRGDFPEVDTPAILAGLIASKGKNKGKIRASMVSPLRSEGITAARTYYVWRLARFHGGKDCTLPMTADMVVRGDPFKKELDTLSEQVAKASFGTDMAAAVRWGRAFGMI